MIFTTETPSNHCHPSAGWDPAEQQTPSPAAGLDPSLRWDDNYEGARQ